MGDEEKIPNATEVLAALRGSHERLVATLSPLDDQQVAAPSYAEEWTVAQVASHLGSGAEIFTLFLQAGLEHTSTPGIEALQPIWATWNAKPPHPGRPPTPSSRTPPSSTPSTR